MGVHCLGKEFKIMVFSCSDLPVMALCSLPCLISQAVASVPSKNFPPYLCSLGVFSFLEYSPEFSLSCIPAPTSHVLVNASSSFILRVNSTLGGKASPIPRPVITPEHLSPVSRRKSQGVLVRIHLDHEPELLRFSLYVLWKGQSTPG